MVCENVCFESIYDIVLLIERPIMNDDFRANVKLFYVYISVYDE